MISESDLKQFPAAQELLETVRRKYIIFRNTYDYILANTDREYLAFCEELIALLEAKNGAGAGIEEGIKAFIRFSHEFLVLQRRLEIEGKYAYSSFKEANDDVYQNPERMDRYYLDGLLLTQVLWPNHYRLGRYFNSCRAMTDDSSCILDVPSGTGIYTYYLAKNFPFRKLDSVDISPYSVEYTKALIGSSGLSLKNKEIKYELKDVFEIPSREIYDFISCGELLEHLEDPEGMLVKLKSLLKDSGKLFLTAAVYAANIDHIYLFNNAREVQGMVEKHFIIESELILPTTMQEYEPSMNNVPINYACVVRKRN